MIMRIIVMVMALAGCRIVSAAVSRNLNIQDDTLYSWPIDFKGEAVIPPQVRHIGSDAFSGCKGLTSVIFPQSIETIGSFAFSGCNHLQDLRIPISVTNIGSSAFFDCQSLTNLEICAELQKLPRNMCSFCYGLKHVELSYGPIEIGDKAFRGCRSLQTIKIPGSVKRIGREAFVGCSRLLGIELPKGIEIVEEFAFYGCYDLKWLFVHEVPSKVGSSAFKDCHNLRGFVVAISPLTNALYSVSSGNQISAESICNSDCFIGSYETLEAALLVVDKLDREGSHNAVLEGLEQVFRIAADGMTDEMADRNFPVGTIDAIAANLFKLSESDDIHIAKSFFKSYAPISLDLGDELVVYLCSQNDIVITIKFNDGKINALTLSKGLKDVIRRKLKRGNGAFDDSVLQWVR